MKRGTRALTSGLLAAVLGTLVLLVIVNLSAAVPGSTVAAPAPAPLPVLPSASASMLAPLGTDATDAGAPMPDAAVLAEALDATFGNGAADDGGAIFGASVADVATGQELYSRQGAAPGVPASSLKVFTAAAALAELGPDRRLRTVVRRGAGNRVVLVGGGDVLLGTAKSGTAESGTAAEGRASLAVLARDTAAALLAGRDGRTITGKVEVLLDDTLFAGATLSPAWDESLVSSGNIAPVQPLALHGARQDTGRDSPRVADPALAAAQAFRALLAQELKQQQAARKASSSPSPSTSTTPSPTPASSPASATPPEAPAVPLGVAGTVARGSAPEGAAELAAVESAPLREQLRHMGEESDNYVAEAVGRLVALEAGKPATFGGATEAVKEAVGRLGVDTAGLVLADTSGLAAANQVSPEQLAATLRAAASSEKPALRELSYLLPVAGATGTLGDRLTGAATSGTVRAKTGSLTGVATLTGYAVTSEGRVLAFSFFAQGVPAPLAPARATLDAAATVLSGCGCR
ncbi:D-alanyl-D-alanine carboxypeptidase/D-alanyl-D-alanine-endopeptidase [Zafaria cholistanensis]|uniref:D-alanyl-D-alanine carboxypeptidase/D-alanyl-D-alanine-endopeptidase n=1 Tax=Zafaria cholistanensis TaxID=1682741 RepID=A0A5A7NPT4_9MICC|nr:D-alanyl-D-alanine carboxypeptidase/D-alanyl-D-alanine-endopeptidase [Zafaria cholistanensis]GER22893.1 D-alanyl-D-alanine carboxypeptidase/D-alanyl-D-alanine-endopeptidase [Zafaria cholistanensis]